MSNKNGAVSSYPRGHRGDKNEQVGKQNNCAREMLAAPRVSLNENIWLLRQ